jgi:hypothetical protein
MREIDPLDLVATIHGDLPVLDFDLSTRFAPHFLGEGRGLQRQEATGLLSSPATLSFFPGQPMTSSKSCKDAQKR